MTVSRVEGLSEATEVHLALPRAAQRLPYLIQSHDGQGEHDIHAHV